MMDDLSPSREELGDLAEGAALSRAERRDQATKRILDAARKCFVASGFQGASMHQICAAAQMSPGALYRYFPSKEAIIKAIAETDRREDMQTFEAMFDNPSVVDGVADATMAYIRHIHARDMAPLFAEVRAESMRNEMIRATCLEHRDGVVGRFETYLASAVADGQIAPDVEMATLLAMFLAIGEGFALNNLLALGIPEDEVETLVRAMVAAMLKPLAPARRAQEK